MTFVSTIKFHSPIFELKINFIDEILLHTDSVNFTDYVQR